MRQDYTYLTINGAGFTCESDCPDGYYPSGVNAIGRTCRPCSDGCLKCATAGECKQCGGQKYRVPDGWMGAQVATTAMVMAKQVELVKFAPETFSIALMRR
eukprot:g27987.t1